MSMSAYKEVTFSGKKCHESCKISMLGWAPIHTSQLLDLLARVVISIKQLTVRAPYQGHSRTQGRFPRGVPLDPQLPLILIIKNSIGQGLILFPPMSRE